MSDTDTQTESSGEGTGTSDGQGGSGSKTYTQQEVNRFVEDRLNRERRSTKKAQEKAILDGIQAWRDEQGLTDEVMQRMADSDKGADELRKARGETTTLRKQLEAATKDRDRFWSVVQQEKLRGAVYRAAGPMANDPEDVWLRLQPRLRLNVESLDVEVLGDGGEPESGTTIEKLVTTLLKEKPHLAKPVSGEGSGGRPPGRAPAAGDKKLTREESNQKLARAIAEGRI